ncbi:NUDIX domain-containing protein [Paludibacter sp.]
MYVNPSSAVAAFILNEKDELLVCVRAHEPSKGMWDLPGGFIDDLETAETAITREIKEELGIEVAEGAFVFSEPNQYTYSGWTLPTLDIFFLFRVKDVVPMPADDVADCFFVPVDQIDINNFGFISMRKAIVKFREQFKNSINHL